MHADKIPIVRVYSKCGKETFFYKSVSVLVFCSFSEYEIFFPQKGWCLYGFAIPKKEHSMFETGVLRVGFWCNAIIISSMDRGYFLRDFFCYWFLHTWRNDTCPCPSFCTHSHSKRIIRWLSSLSQAWKWKMDVVNWFFMTLWSPANMRPRPLQIFKTILNF